MKIKASEGRAIENISGEIEGLSKNFGTDENIFQPPSQY